MRRVGIIGCGAVVEKMYLPVLQVMPEARVVGVTDVDGARASHVAAQCSAQRMSRTELLRNCGLDLVVVATPPATHFDLVSECLAAGLDVLCEKPFVGTGREARALVQAAAASGRALWVGHFRRCFPATVLARTLIATGGFGKVKRITCLEGGRFAWRPYSGYTSQSQLGGVLFDTGSHTVDMALYAAGLDEQDADVSIDRAHADGPEPSSEIDFQATLFVSGRSIVMQTRLSRLGPLANCISIECESATVMCSVALKNVVRIRGRNGACTVVTAQKPANLVQCFGWQCERIVLRRDTDCFSARRFVTLSAVLEAVAAEVDRKCASRS